MGYHPILSLASTGQRLFAGTGWFGGVFLSTDAGTSWTPANIGLPSAWSVNALAVCDASGGTGVPYLFAGTTNGIFRSTDSGTSWTVADGGVTTDTILTLAAIDTILFAGTERGGIFVSTNGGTSWTEVNEGLPTAKLSPKGFSDIQCLASNGKCLFAGTFDAGVWKRSLDEMITAAELWSSAPCHFSLEQNFPNPFNPSTTIRYGLPTRSHVTITIFNILGQEVAQLANGEVGAGYHEVRFDGSGLSSGLYLCRLRAMHYSAAIGLLLMK